MKEVLRNRLEFLCSADQSRDVREAAHDALHLIEKLEDEVEILEGRVTELEDEVCELQEMLKYAEK